MEEVKEYKLKTIEDIVRQIPMDRVDVFVEEFRDYIKTAKGVVNLIGLTAEAIGQKPVLDKFGFGYEMVWRDDGERHQTIRVDVSTKGKDGDGNG